jgi:hypothetical protein
MKPSQRKLYSVPRTQAAAVKIVIPPPPVPAPSPSHLYKFSDGSVLRAMDAKELASLDIWHSQRTLDPAHKEQIKKQVTNTIQALDGSLYHIVRYPPDEDGEADIRRIIDGQHRASILKDYFATPEAKGFTVLVKEKFCKTEEEAIQYFKVLNHTKAIEWKEDPKLVAQKYLNALLTIFDNETSKFFRVGKTKRPFIQIDKLLAVFLNRRIGMRMELTPDEFAGRAVEWNETKIDHILNQAKKSTLEDHALSIGFTLGLDENFGWLDTIV